MMPALGGSYTKTCKNISYTCSEGFPVLHASCRKTNGSWRKTALWYYHLCEGDIRNDNGVLKCKRSGLAGAAEFGVDRFGKDYRCFFTSKDFFGCVDACSADEPCKAFTWVKPGIKGKEAMCCLKKSVPPTIPNNCCISGRFE
jgi:hypothetical protein